MADLLLHAGRSSRLGTLLLGASLALLVRPGPAAAVPIMDRRPGHTHVPISSPEADDFRAFLAGGPHLWATSPAMKIPPWVTIFHTDGQLRHSRVVAYLTWMRDRNPTVFDAHHPTLGPILAQAEAQKAARAEGLRQATSIAIGTAAATAGGQTTAATATPAARVSHRSPSVSAAEMLADPVPEPSTLLMALMLGGPTAWWYRRRRAR